MPRNESTTAGVLAAAQQMLADGRPRLRFAAKIVESAGTRYGIHWRWGDRVTALYAGETYDAMIRAIVVSVDATGQGDDRGPARGVGMILDDLVRLMQSLERRVMRLETQEQNTVGFSPDGGLMQCAAVAG